MERQRLPAALTVNSGGHVSMTLRLKPALVAIVLLVVALGLGAVWLGVISLATALILALVLCCPLMMLFMHGGGGQGGSSSGPETR